MAIVIVAPYSTTLMLWQSGNLSGAWIYVDRLCFFSVLCNCLLCLCGRQFICALSSPAGKGLTSWLSFVVSNCEFVTFPLVSWVRCGTWLYRFLIFASLLTMEFPPQKCSVLSVSRSRSPIRHSYKLNGHILITEDTAKYLELGVDLQTTLSWKTHIDRISKKPNSMLGFLRHNLRNSK